MHIILTRATKETKQDCIPQNTNDGILRYSYNPQEGKKRKTGIGCLLNKENKLEMVNKLDESERGELKSWLKAQHSES